MNPALIRRCDKFLKTARQNPERPRLLAQGDSWLALPGGLWPGKSVVDHLANRSWLRSQGAAPLNVLSVADPAKHLSKMARDPRLHDVLAYLQLRGEDVDYRFDAVLITGSGNDILDNPRVLIDEAGVIREDMLKAALESVRTAWAPLLQLFAPWRCPVITHGYGPITPTLRSAPIIIPGKSIGPWVGDYLLGELKLPVPQAKALIGTVIDRLNDTLSSIDGVSYFDVRDVVAAIPPEEWHDEIHFFEPGWEKLSKAWLQAIQRLVPRASTGSPSLIKAKVGRSKSPLFKQVAPPIRILIETTDAKKTGARSKAVATSGRSKRPR